MTDIQDFTPSQVMAMGYKRIKSIQDRHGINSPEVLSACERWGGILDDINFPDTTCRNCGHPVTYIPTTQFYVHSDRLMGDGHNESARHCVTHAGAQAVPIHSPSGVGFASGKLPQKPLIKRK